MIVNASSRTDIPAYYTEWFMNRIEAGFFDVRNPFYPKSVSRIYMEDVDCFMFCTKNPLPLIPFLKEIDRPILMDVTISPYHKDIEPNVPDKNLIIDGVIKMSEILGREHLTIRYDPVFVSSRYTVDYHIRAFERLCTLLEGKIESITLSFLDEYKNTKKNRKQIGYQDLSEQDYRKLANAFAKSAKNHQIEVFTCNEQKLLEPYGIPSGACFSQKKAYEMTGKVYKKWKARDCGCVEMADIGVYNSCMHMCRYCYANFDEKQIVSNYQNHDPKSSLLIGHLEPDDEIKIRR